MKTILVPVDFSMNAQHAALYAAIIAKKIKAKVEILHVYSIPTVSEYQSPTDIERFITEIEQAAKSQLSQFKEEYLVRSGLTDKEVSVKSEYGLVYDAITRIAKSSDAFLIVVGTKGATNFFDKWIGTNAERVAKNASCPVLIIPEDAPLISPSNVLYAADFEEDEILATQNLIQILKPIQATCAVVHIHEYFEPNIAQQLEKTTAFLAHELDDENIKVSNITRRDIVKGLETYVRTHKPDVLALAIHEKSFFEGLFKPSITKHFIEESNVPILTFKK